MSPNLELDASFPLVFRTANTSFAAPSRHPNLSTGPQRLTHRGGLGTAWPRVQDSTPQLEHSQLPAPLTPRPTHCPGSSAQDAALFLLFLPSGHRARGLQSVLLVRKAKALQEEVVRTNE